MVRQSAPIAPVYRPRRPRSSPLYRLIERYFPDFERSYDDRYAKRYGPWRPIIGEVVRKFLRCGDLHFGFARVRCTGCRHEMFVPYSCRQRCLCPSCHQKRSLLSAATITQTICAPRPHRQFVFTIPKRLRIFFRHDRGLLGKLAGAAWETVAALYRQRLQRNDAQPGMIVGIQTFGGLLHFHPHIHAIVTDGAFTPDGRFIGLPRRRSDLLLTSWQSKVFEILLVAEKIDRQTVDEMRAWCHSGFSVDNSVYLPSRDTAALERLAQYILRCPFSLARVVRLTDDGSLIYRAEADHCRQFPGPASADLRGGPRRNFQVFRALDFLADLTQHIPEKGEHLVRYYGWYSHRQRGQRAKKLAASAESARQKATVPLSPTGLPAAPLNPQSKKPLGRLALWAMLIQRVFEVDPLQCPECGGRMKVVSFIERRQRDVIERILRHCGLWEGPIRTLPNARAPPPPRAKSNSDEPRELQLVLDPEYL